MSNQNPTNGSQGSSNYNPWGNVFGSLGTGIGDLFGANAIGNMQFNNPANSAMPYLNQIRGYLQGQYSPYIQQGQGAYNQLAPQYQRLLSDGGNLQNAYSNLYNNPGQAVNQIGQNYHSSPGYQFNVQQATQAANNAAAAGGMAGSPQEQQYLASTVSGLANQDYNNYLQNAMGVMNTGLQGASNLYGEGLQGEQNLQQQGFNANNELAQSVANTLLSQGNLAYAGAANQNQFNQLQQMLQAGLQSGGIGSLFGSLGSLFGMGGNSGSNNNLFGELGTLF